MYIYCRESSMTMIFIMAVVSMMDFMARMSVVFVMVLMSMSVDFVVYMTALMAFMSVMFFLSLMSIRALMTEMSTVYDGLDCNLHMALIIEISVMSNMA